MYRTLLWATDGSPDADLALQEATKLLAPRGRLVAFHCDQRFLGGRSSGAPILPDDLERQRHIRAQVEELRASGIDASFFVETTSRSTPDEIADVADDVGAEAIVCGTRGLGGLRAILNGSVSSALLRHANVPVIVVPAAAGDRTTAAV